MDRSPWPVFSAFGVLYLATGGVMYMHSYKQGLFLFLSGGFVLASVVFCWWSDIISEGTGGGFHTIEVQCGLRLGMLLFIVSEVMFFVAFFWAFFHSSLSPAIEIGAEWPPAGITPMDVWGVPFLNTLLLLLSGVFVTMVHLGVLEGSAVVSYDAVGWNFLFSGGAENVKSGWLRGSLGNGTTEYSYVLEVQNGLDEVLPFSLGEPSIQPGLVLLFELVYLLLEVEYAGYPWYMAPRLLAFGPIVSVWVRALIWYNYFLLNLLLVLVRIGLISLDGSGDDLGLIDNDLALGSVYINLLSNLINSRANQMDWFFMGRLLAYRSYFHRRRSPGMVEFSLVSHVVMTWLSSPNIKVFYTAIGQMEWSVALGILWSLRWDFLSSNVIPRIEALDLKGSLQSLSSTDSMTYLVPGQAILSSFFVSSDFWNGCLFLELMFGEGWESNVESFCFVLYTFIFTLSLAFLFLCFQFVEYRDAYFGISDGIYGSTFYMATGFHGFHVLVGLSFLVICFGRFASCHFSPSHHVGLEAAIWYWHFVDVVWIYLFVSIYWWGNGSLGF